AMRMLPKPGLRSPSTRLIPIIRDVAAALDPTSLLERAGYDAPEPWQEKLLLSTAKRVAVLCPRQVGKSTTTAAMALFHALYRPGFMVVIVSPSERQSNLLFEKVIDMLNNLRDKPS